MRHNNLKKKMTALLAGIMVTSNLMPIIPALAAPMQTPNNKALQHNQIELILQQNALTGKWLSTHITNEISMEKDFTDESKWYNNNILGTSVMSAEKMAAALTDVNSNVSDEYALRIAKAYLEIGSYYGLRGDIAFFQAMLETGYLRSGGGEDDDYHNFCGMMNDYMTGYAVYDSPEEGIEAHIQLLYGYASNEAFPSSRKLIEKRAPNVNRGTRTTWESLGGTWAVPGYDDSVFRSLGEARTLHKSYGDLIIGNYASAGGTDVATSVKPGRTEPYMSNPDYVATSMGPKAYVWIGLKGDAIKELQEILKELGYAPSMDGLFDKTTESAVIEFQKAKNLDADGIVGSGTWGALANAYISKTTGIPVQEETKSQDTSSSKETTQQTTKQNTTAKTFEDILKESSRPQMFPGESGEYITAIQKLLNAQGYQLSEDGDYGSLTYRAVIKYQNENKLDPDGIVGPATWKAMIDGYNKAISTEAKPSQTASGDASSPSASSPSGGSSGNASSQTSSATETKTEDTKKETEQKQTEQKAQTPSNLPSVSGRPTLYKWKESEDVKALQTLLNYHGASLEVDGVFGGDTEKAILAFQREKNLDVDGIVGEQTWKALGTESGKATPASSTEASKSDDSSKKTETSSGQVSVSGRSEISYGDEGEDVLALQKILNTKGASLEEDGIFGYATYSAVTSFQRSNNLDVDGIVGPQTWAKLG